jgi:hypothetical protein
MCAPFFSVTFVRNISRLDKYVTSYIQDACRNVLGFHIKRDSLPSDFNENLNVTIDFSEISQYQIL